MKIKKKIFIASMMSGLLWFWIGEAAAQQVYKCVCTDESVSCDKNSWGACQMHCGVLKVSNKSKWVDSAKCIPKAGTQK